MASLEVDQELREAQSQYQDFLDDEVKFDNIYIEIIINTTCYRKIKANIHNLLRT